MSECNCPNCKKPVIPDNDTVNISYGVEGFTGKLYIRYCTECGYVFSDGTWAE